jgi:hypothetical protein
MKRAPCRHGRFGRGAQHAGAHAGHVGESRPAALGTPRDGFSAAAARELAAFRVCAIRLHTALETAKQAANAVIADVSFDGEASRPLYKLRGGAMGTRSRLI